MSTDAPVRFGILGAGRIAVGALAPAIHECPLAELTAAASRDISRAKEMKPKRAYGSYDELLGDPEVEVVVVATHNGLHHEQTVAALKRGKHVLCEKPLACTSAECNATLRQVLSDVGAQPESAVEVPLLLEEAFMYRFHPQIAAALEIAKSGEIGLVRAVEATFSFVLTKEDDVRLNPDWGGGAVYDVGCYCINLCRTFLGEPRSVKGVASFHPLHKVDMALHGLLDFGADRFGVISCGFDSSGVNDAVIRGTRGNIRIPSPFWVNRRPAKIEIDGAKGSRTLSFKPVDLYLAEIEDFAKAVRTGARQAFLPMTDGAQNVRVIEALLRSAHELGTPVAP